MKLQTTITALLISLLLSFSACNNSSKPKEQTLNTISNEIVLVSTQEADSYSWSQLSGIKVVLINSDKRSMSFIAPVVSEDNVLMFKVLYTTTTVLNDVNIQSEKVKVIVHPLETQSDDNETAPIETNPLKSILLTISNTSLNIDTNTSLNTIAIYEDNTTKDITQEVEWINSDSNAIQIDKRQLQAKLNAITSNAVALEIYQNINGHRLPPMPNKTLNDSTLLGIDSNNNGVRDDVERWIYEKYEKKHPVHIDIAMQAGRAYKLVLETPERALEIMSFVDAPQNCGDTHTHYRKYIRKPYTKDFC